MAKLYGALCGLALLLLSLAGNAAASRCVYALPASPLRTCRGMATHGGEGGSPTTSAAGPARASAGTAPAIRTCMGPELAVERQGTKCGPAPPAARSRPPYRLLLAAVQAAAMQAAATHAAACRASPGLLLPLRPFSLALPLLPLPASAPPLRLRLPAALSRPPAAAASAGACPQGVGLHSGQHRL